MNCGLFQKSGMTKCIDRQCINICDSSNKINKYFLSYFSDKAVTKKVKSPRSSTGTSISMSAMQGIVEKLKNERNRTSTRRNYHDIWRSFNEFFIRLDVKPQAWEDRVTLFVGYLIQEKKAKSSTIKSYISAIRSVLLEDGIILCENKFLLASLTKACRYINDKVRTRLPIHKEMLIVLIRQVEADFLQIDQQYLATMYKAIFSTAYYGLFRIGELATGSHPILARDVHVGENKDKLLFVLRTSKTHWRDQKPQTVKINSAKIYNKSEPCSPFCPFQILSEYVKARRTYRYNTEPFFVFGDRTPVPSTLVRTVLKRTLEKAGFNKKLYNFQSFRIGRASDMVLKYNVDVQVLKQLGRWRSNIVYEYLRN